VPGFPLTIGTTASCFHQAPAKIAPAQSAVTIVGQPVATSGSQIGVIGCPFTLPSATPQPCITISWAMPSAKVTVQTQPLLLMPPPNSGIGPGICKGAPQLPQGPATVKVNQTKVFAT
jgi:hypothetical protein